jgi:hypothetical protein
MDPGLQDHASTRLGKIIHPKPFWWLQTLIHGDRMNGTKLVEVVFERPHHGVKPQRMANHKQTAGAGHRFDNINGFARVAGHGLLH